MEIVIFLASTNVQQTLVDANNHQVPHGTWWLFFFIFLYIVFLIFSLFATRRDSSHHVATFRDAHRDASRNVAKRRDSVANRGFVQNPRFRRDRCPVTPKGDPPLGVTQKYVFFLSVQQKKKTDPLRVRNAIIMAAVHIPRPSVKLVIIEKKSTSIK